MGTLKDSNSPERFPKGILGGPLSILNDVLGISCKCFEDFSNGPKVAELRRFHTSPSGNVLIGLKEYVNRMKEGRNDFSYIIAEGLTAVSSSPFSEGLRKKGLEVLYVVTVRQVSEAWDA